MLLLLASLLYSQTLDQPGPLTVSSASNVSVTLASGSITADVYWPASGSPGAPFVPVVVGHGFARSAAPMTNWGRHFASHGFVTAVINFPAPTMPDHVRNGALMRELLGWLRTSPQPIGVAVDAQRGAYAGHSAGGLAAILAASGDPSIDALIGLDPVDANSLGSNAGANVTATTLVLASEPHACNSQGSASSLYSAIGAQAKAYARVTGASHCDPEDPSDNLCPFACGTGNSNTRAYFRRYATATLLIATACRALEHLPGGSRYNADVASGALSSPAFSPVPPCGPATDAGVRPDSGAAIDSGVAIDTGISEDSGASADAEAADAIAAQDAASSQDASIDPDGGTTTEDASVATQDASASDSSTNQQIPGSRARKDNCACSSTETRSHPLLTAALLAFVVLRRRRR